MQKLLVQLLQQLHGSETTDKPYMQQMLLFGCCECLQVVRLPLTTAHLSVNLSVSSPRTAAHKSHTHAVTGMSACPDVVQ